MISLHVKAHKDGELNTGQGGVGQYVHTGEEEQVGAGTNHRGSTTKYKRTTNYHNKNRK